ncbi:11006_t:CDS:2 [Entrophospora sp. SA101]|nr:11006_t:CDS:2 [Entrophospora sp. SA101]
MVPFQLTQNIVTALGVIGIFRIVCKNVLRVMFLEAFFYDPLVDLPLPPSSNDIYWRKIWSSYTEYPDFKSLSMSHSFAVMSDMIGLREHHLDNILIDLIMKGRIPEMVPFQLTQNIVTALGVIGIFRIVCKNVLRVMFLEAFFYDPLVLDHDIVHL